MMKKFLLGLLIATLGLSAQAQPFGLNVGQTPVIGGTAGQALTIGAGGLLSSASGLAPSGTAGGDLAGSTYPNPTIKPAVSLTGAVTMPTSLAIGGGSAGGGISLIVSNGDISSASNNIRSAGNFRGANSNSFLFLDNGTGLAAFTTAGGVSGLGVLLDYSVDGTLKLRNRGNSANANVTANDVTANGNAIVGAQVQFVGTSRLSSSVDGQIVFSNAAATNSVIFTAAAATATPNLRLGGTDAAAPVAQTLSAQGVVAGTLNTTSPSWTIQSGASTGNVNGGTILFKVSQAGGSGTAQNAPATSLQVGAGGITVFGPVTSSGDGRYTAASGTVMNLNTDGTARFSNSANTNSATISFPTATATPTFQFGAADAAAPIAQTVSVQSVVAGTSNTAGANLTIAASRGTGTGVGGSHIFQVAPAGTTGSAQNALITAMVINASANVGISSVGSANIKLRITGATGATTNHGLFIEDSGGNTNLDVLDNGTVALGRGSVATNATGGYPILTGGAGAPTGVPAAIGAYVPMYVDTTNSQLYLYIGGAWKQPKTPAGAALVTWQ